MYSSSEMESSVLKGTYSRLDQTYCGKGIPKVPYETYDPPLPKDRNGQCPADWNLTNVPSMSTQIVMNTFQYPDYTSLTHNSPYSSSRYFTFNPAYGNGQNGYEPVYRSCDGSIQKVALS